MINHLVARVEQSTQRDVDRFGNSDRDEDLAGGVVLDIKKAADIFRDRFAQREQAKVGGVGCLTFFQRIDRRLADVPRRGKVRLADAEGNDIVAPLHEFKEIADPGARDRGDVAGDFRLIVHGRRGAQSRNLTQAPPRRQCPEKELPQFA